MEELSLHGDTHEDHHQHIRLACQACQRKKVNHSGASSHDPLLIPTQIKCDRNYPCGQCSRSNLQCAPSTRKPRARHAGKRAVDSELRNRISKLENLVESLSGEVGLQDEEPNDETNREATPKDPGAASPAVGKYIGSPFWSSLTTEVQALRDALEEDQADRDAEEHSPITSSNGGNANNPNGDYDLIICPPGAVYVMPGALNEPSPEMAASLYGAFLERIAPLFKTFHIPTLRAFLQRGQPYLGHDANAMPNRALKAALWYAPVSAMSDAYCKQQYGASKSDLGQRFRRCVDTLFSQADLMNTTDYATLQALITYLVRIA